MIFTRVTSRVASLARISSVICSMVKPCACITASVQPSGHEASNTSARRWRPGCFWGGRGFFDGMSAKDRACRGESEGPPGLPSGPLAVALATAAIEMPRPASARKLLSLSCPSFAYLVDFDRQNAGAGSDKEFPAHGSSTPRPLRSNHTRRGATVFPFPNS